MTKHSKLSVLMCARCGPFVRAYAEVWVGSHDAPAALLFLQHAESGIERVHEIKLLPKVRGKKKELLFCGYCLSPAGVVTVREYEYHSMEQWYRNIPARRRENWS